MKRTSMALAAAAIAVAATVSVSIPANAATSSYGPITCASNKFVRVYGYASGATTVYTSAYGGTGAYATYSPGPVLTYHSYTSSFLHAATFTGISTSTPGTIQKGGDGKACA